MPRAHRHYLPNHVWHLTHRCHNKQAILSEAHHRDRWLRLLRAARAKYQLPVLGYMATCNHVHLLVQDLHGPDTIPRTMQYVQGQFALWYNRIAGRQNAVWGDRYHATAVETGLHLRRCLAYIDLNMVRAGVVERPGDWLHCGYHELQAQRPRSPIIDLRCVADLLGTRDLNEMRAVHLLAIEDAVRRDGAARTDPLWSESLAVGSRQFVENFRTQLAQTGRDPTKRGMAKVWGHHEATWDAESAATMALREPHASYGGDSTSEEPAAFLQGDNTVRFTI